MSVSKHNLRVLLLYLFSNLPNLNCKKPDFQIGRIKKYIFLIQIKNFINLTVSTAILNRKLKLRYKILLFNNL